MYSEHLRRRDLHNDDGKQFEDRGDKHLYEAHHDCSKDECEFCKKIMQHPHELSNFFIENEEMCCEDAFVNYDKLHEINIEREKIDELNKKCYPSTLIPPPTSEEECCRKVYVSELSVDLSKDFGLPHTIQDPVYVAYDQDVLCVRLKKEDKDDIRRCAILKLLNDIMKNIGNEERVYTFTTLKYNIKAMGVSGEFYENFVLDVVRHCLHFAMKEINGCLVNRKFRPIFSPSIVYLLKTLNAFQCAFELGAELTSLDLTNE